MGNLKRDGFVTCPEEIWVCHLFKGLLLAQTYITLILKEPNPNMHTTPTHKTNRSCAHEDTQEGLWGHDLFSGFALHLQANTPSHTIDGECEVVNLRRGT